MSSSPRVSPFWNPTGRFDVFDGPSRTTRVGERRAGRLVAADAMRGPPTSASTADRVSEEATVQVVEDEYAPC
jgi:hypothetical protein